MSKRVTLADIAKLAGVSRSTVSRALQDSPLISAATKQQIQQIAQQQNYRPNLVARNLRLNKSNTIAFVLPSMKNREHLMDPFLSKFIGAIGTALRDQNYDLLITQANLDDPDIGLRYLRSGRADGIIFIGRTTANEPLVAQIAANAPMVVWGPQLDNQTYCSVGIDNRLWSQKGVAHLISLGRRRIAFLGEDPRWIEVIHRFQGYQAALQQATLPLDPNLIAYMSSADRAGKLAMQTLLAQAPDLDAVFANSDVAAIAAMQVLRENGRSVPHDVAVLGFDNISVGNYTTPSLTTISQNLTHGIPILIDKLLQLIDGQTPASLTVPGQLVIRQSSGALST